MSDKREKQKPERLVVVYYARGLLEANVIKGKLASVGIPAMLKYESAAPVMGLVMDSMGEVQVLVAATREQDALAALKTD